jgi:flagellar biosynthesis chaperone FliJ
MILISTFEIDLKMHIVIVYQRSVTKKMAESTNFTTEFITYERTEDNRDTILNSGQNEESDQITKNNRSIQIEGPDTQTDTSSEDTKSSGQYLSKKLKDSTESSISYSLISTPEMSTGDNTVSHLRNSDILKVISEYDFGQNDQIISQTKKSLSPSRSVDSDSDNSQNSDDVNDTDDADDANAFDELTKSQDSDSCPDFSKIDHTVVLYNKNYARSRGSLGQIIRSIEDMKERSQTPDPNNAYQVHLYPTIMDMCDKIVDRYVELISKVPHSEYIVFGHYLNGTNNDGQMKETKIRHEKKAYRYSQMKETLKSVKDRLRHISANARRCSKDITRTKENRVIFKRVINFCSQFNSDVEGYIANWEHEVKKCREICSIDQNSSSGRSNQRRSKPISTRVDSKTNTINSRTISDHNLVPISKGPNSNIKKLVI